MSKSSSPLDNAASRPLTEASHATPEELIVSLLEHSPAPIYVVGTDGRYLVVNRAWEQVAGKCRADVLGLKMSDIFADETTRHFTESDEAVRRTGRSVTCEQKLEQPDGMHYYQTVKFPLHNALGQVESVGGMSFDITRRKRVEQALAREYDLLRALMNSSPDAIYFKDCASTFQRINLALARILGVADPKAAIGKTDADFFVPALAQAARADEQRVMETRQPLVAKIEKVTRLDGVAHWFSTTKSPVVDDRGEVTGIVGISRAVPPPAAADRPAPRVAATVLLVEDDVYIREYEQRILETAGFRVLSATDGQEGLRLFVEHGPALAAVVTDLVMPNLNGASLIAEIRQVSATIPVIVAAGCVDGPLADQVRRLPVQAWVKKPVAADMLVAAVRQAVSRPV